jgi:hypothetical protein
MRNKTVRWSLEENEIGRRLLDKDASEAKFLEKLGRTKKAAIGHFSYIEHRAMVLRRRSEVSSARGELRQMTMAGAPSMVGMSETRRVRLTPRSLTSEFFGDPPPGRSALEGK